MRGRDPKEKRKVPVFLTYGLQVTHKLGGLNVEVQNVIRSQAFKKWEKPSS